MTIVGGESGTPSTALRLRVDRRPNDCRGMSADASLRIHVHGQLVMRTADVRMRTQVCMCVGMCVDACMDARMDMRIDTFGNACSHDVKTCGIDRCAVSMSADTCAETSSSMRVDMRVDMLVDMCVDMCVDMYTDMPRPTLLCGLYYCRTVLHKPAHMLIHMSIHMSVQMSIQLPIHVSTHTHIHMPTHIPTHLPTHMPTNMPTRASVYMPTLMARHTLIMTTRADMLMHTSRQTPARAHVRPHAQTHVEHGVVLVAERVAQLVLRRLATRLHTPCRPCVTARDPISAGRRCRCSGAARSWRSAATSAKAGPARP